MNNRLFYKVEYAYVFIAYFLFLFGFGIPIVGNSSYLGAFLLVLLLVKKNVIINVPKFMKKKNIMMLFFFQLLVLIISYISPVYNGTYDYSINTTIINNIISLFINCICLSYFFNENDGGKRSIFKFLSLIFLLQCVIIFLMLIFPDVKLFIQAVIRTDAQLDRMGSYNGVRGLGLTGFIAFGLSITMGILFPVFCFWIKKYVEIPDSIKIAFVVLSIIACLSAGRTSILGVFLGLYILLLSDRLTFKYIFKIFKVNIYLLVFSVCIIYVIFENKGLYDVAYYYSRYVFQSIWNYIEHGSFAINSLKHLDSMYFYPDDLNWFIGNGHYTNDDGSYYLNTDAGYMRFVLFFGVIGSFLMYFSFSIFSVTTIYRIKDKQFKYLLFIIFMASFIYHYKGEVIMFSVPYMKVYLLIFLIPLLDEKVYRDHD